MSASNSSSHSHSGSEGIRLAVVGSRNYSQEFEEYIFEKLDLFLDSHLPRGSVEAVISGGATGADSIARKWANERGIEIIEYLAEWKKYGKSAGPRRNTLIVNDCTHLVAFPLKGSRGTWDSVRKGKKGGKSVEIYNFSERNKEK